MGREPTRSPHATCEPYTMDCLSSATWASTINAENKSRKLWKAKYGHQFDLPDSAENSRAPTAMSQRGDEGKGGSRPATGMSRPATGMSQASQMSQGTQAKRQQLIDLKKKLMNALAEVDDELAETRPLDGTKSRRSNY